MIRFRKIFFLLIVLVCVLLALPACQSVKMSTKFKVYKMHPDAEPEKDIGIPINMTKPQFYINEKLPDLEKQELRYEVVVEYVPDADNRYALNIDPAYLNEIDFVLNLGDFGQLTQVNMANREKVTDTITAVGEVAAGVIGVMTKAVGIGALPAVGDVTGELYKPKFIKLIDDKPDAIWTYDNSQRDLSYYRKPVDKDVKWEEHGLNDTEADAWKELKIRIEKSTSQKELFSTIYPQNPDERRWFQTAYKRISDKITGIKKVEKELAEKSEKIWRKDTLNINDLVKPETNDELMKIHAKIFEAVPKDINQANFNTFLGKLKNNTLSDQEISIPTKCHLLVLILENEIVNAAKENNTDQLSTLKLIILTTDFSWLEIDKDQFNNYYEALIKNANFFIVDKIDLPTYEAEQKELDAIIKLSDTQWRFRHVRFLESEIDKLKHKQITGTLTAGEVAHLKKLKDWWDQTVEVTAERKRICVLKKTLKAIAAKESENRLRPIRETPPMEDYRIVRDEISKLYSIILNKRAALSPKTKTPPPAFRAMPAVIWLSTNDTVKDEMPVKAFNTMYQNNSGENSWSQGGKDKKEPEFVIIIEPKGGQK